MSEHYVIVLGGLNTDYLVKGERLPGPGETLQGESFREAAGGKGANQAVAVARLGCRVGIIARVGADDRGERIIRQLATEGVDVTQVLRDEEASTGVALIMVDRSGEKQILAALGANRRVSAGDVSAARTIIASAGVLLAQLEAPVPAVALALRLAREAGVKTVLDPAPAVPLDDDLLRQVDVIRPNASEAATLTGVRVRDRATARRAARTLLDRGVGAVVVQAGEAGDLLVTPEGERLLPRVPVDSVDATGAGDAFAAALSVGLAEGRPLPEAATMGSAAAALATTRLGAQAGLPDRRELENLLRTLPLNGGSMAKKKSSSRKSSSRRYGKKASKSVESAMRRRKRGTLRSGKGGRGGKVKSRKQAIAIGLSEARKKGAKVPPKRKRSKSKSSSKSRSRS